MIIPVEKKMCPPGLKERETGSLRNLTRLCMPYIWLVEAVLSDVRMTRDRTSSSLLSMVHVPFQA